MGATHRSRRNVFVIIRAASCSRGCARDMRAGGQSRPGSGRVSTWTDDDVGTATNDVVRSVSGGVEWLFRGPCTTNARPWSVWRSTGPGMRQMPARRALDVDSAGSRRFGAIEARPMPRRRAFGASPVLRRVQSPRRTIGRIGLAALCSRRSTTSNPARSNIDSVPWYTLADGMRPPSGISTG